MILWIKMVLKSLQTKPCPKNRDNLDPNGGDGLLSRPASRILKCVWALEIFCMQQDHLFVLLCLCLYFTFFQFQPFPAGSSRPVAVCLCFCIPLRPRRPFQPPVCRRKKRSEADKTLIWKSQQRRPSRTVNFLSKTDKSKIFTKIYCFVLKLLF